MGKTKNYRLSEDEKRIHREAVEIRKKTDKQLIEYIEGEKEDFRRRLKAMDIAADVIGDFKADGYFRDTDTKRTFLKKLSEIPGTGKSIMKKIEGAAADRRMLRRPHVRT